MLGHANMNLPMAANIFPLSGTHDKHTMVASVAGPNYNHSPISTP